MFGEIGFVCIFAITPCHSSLPIFDELASHTAQRCLKLRSQIVFTKNFTKIWPFDPMMKTFSLYPCIGFKNNKEINKPLSENNHTMIESTFWSKKVQRSFLCLISVSEVSLRVTDTLLFSAPSMVTDKICYRKAVSVKCLVPQDRSQTLISELPQQVQTDSRGHNDALKQSSCVREFL